MYSDAYKHDIALELYFNLLNNHRSTLSDQAIAEISAGIADIYDYQEDFDNSLHYYNEALAKAIKATNLAIASKACFKIALIYDDLGEVNKAIEFYSKNIEITDNYSINPYLSASYANIAAIYEEHI